MIARRIRRMKAGRDPVAKFLREIAAQLAEQNEMLRAGDDLETGLRARVADLRGIEPEPGVKPKRR
jgi:hypothetical protein